MYFIHLLQKLKLPGLRRRLRLQLLVALHDLRDHLLLPLDVGPRLWLLVRNEVLIIVIIVVDVAAGVDVADRVDIAHLLVAFLGAVVDVLNHIVAVVFSLRVVTVMAGVDVVVQVPQFGEEGLAVVAMK